MRSLFQSHLYSLGCSIQKHAGKVLFVAILVLSTFCVGLKSATIHSKVHQLWIQGKISKNEKKSYFKRLFNAINLQHFYFESMDFIYFIYFFSSIFKTCTLYVKNKKTTLL